MESSVYNENLFLLFLPVLGVLLRALKSIYRSISCKNVEEDVMMRFLNPSASSEMFTLYME